MEMSEEQRMRLRKLFQNQLKRMNHHARKFHDETVGLLRTIEDEGIDSDVALSAVRPFMHSAMNLPFNYTSEAAALVEYIEDYEETEDDDDDA